MGYQIKNAFIENHAENLQQKLVPDLFTVFVNNPNQPLNARNYFKSNILKVDYPKALKKVTSFFYQNQSLSIDKIIKKKAPGTSDQPVFRLRNKFRKIPLLVMYYLTKFDDVI